VEAVKVNVQLSSRRSTGAIVDVVAENPTVDPGTNVVLHVRLQPYRQDPVVKTVSVKLPDAASGTVVLTVRGGDVKPEDGAAKPKAKNQPRSFLELLDALRQKPQASELVVEAPSPDGTMQRLGRLALPFVVTGSRTVDITVRSENATPAPSPAGPDGNGTPAPSEPGPRTPDLQQPPTGTPPPAPEGPKPNGGANAAARSTGGRTP
jgi:hypothetical protein